MLKNNQSRLPDKLYYKSIQSDCPCCISLVKIVFLFTDFPSLDTKGVPKDTRLTFHPDLEIPLLKTWFKSCKTPSAEKLRFYANELNKGHTRQERPKITPARLKIWWKNEKQKVRRLQREHSQLPGQPEYEQTTRLPGRPDYEQESQLPGRGSRSVMLSGMGSLPDKPDLDGGGEARDLVFTGELTSMQTDELPSCSFPDML